MAFAQYLKLLLLMMRQRDLVIWLVLEEDPE
jgi:hypothetical protein